MTGKQYITYHVNGRTVTETGEFPVEHERTDMRLIESNVINLYPEFEFQEIEGFGGAMTESSAYLLMQMGEKERKEALQDIFGEGGLGFCFVRIHMDSCDYSLDEYQAVPDPVADPELETFSIDRDRKYIIPVMKQVLEMSARPISVLLSPWSPPWQWKTPPAAKKNDEEVYGGGGLPGEAAVSDEPQRNNGGSLKPEFYGSWAKYVVKYVRSYLDEGIPVTMMTIQNETVAATCWDSCVWTPEESRIYLQDYLYPEMKKAGLTDKVELYIWDHNKERMIEHAEKVLTDVTKDMIAGIAFHWYSGDHFEAVDLLSGKYPHMKMMLSECCALHRPGRIGSSSPDCAFLTPQRVDYLDAAAYAHDMIGNLNAGMSKWIDWNLVVDEEGGPRHVPGGFTSGLIADKEGGYRRPIMHDYIRHFSVHIMPGAKRIGYSRFGDGIEVTAVRNPDGSIAAVLLNRQQQDQGCYLRVQGTLTRISVPAETISTVVLR